MTVPMPILRRGGFLRRPVWDSSDGFFEDFGLPSLFSRETRVTAAIDVSETKKELDVKAEVPGMNKEDIDINLSDGLLAINGEKKQEKEKNERYYCVPSRSLAHSSCPCIPYIE